MQMPTVDTPQLRKNGVWKVSESNPTEIRVVTMLVVTGQGEE